MVEALLTFISESSIKTIKDLKMRLITNKEVLWHTTVQT